MIFPLWQSLGQSTHTLAQLVARHCGEKATHTGTLDPMAEGVVVILTGEDRFVKGALDWQKRYRFSILWGVETDSLDQLGIILKTSKTTIDLEKIQEALNNFPSQYFQSVPAFSALRHQGKSGFELAREQITTPHKVREVQLSQLTFLGAEQLNSREILTNHTRNISQVSGDFRQQAITESWKQAVPQNTNFFITHHSVTASPGTYIRQIVQDLASYLTVPATTWSITREKNGPYEKSDCVDLQDIAELGLQ